MIAQRKRKTSDVDENLEKYNKSLRFFYQDAHIQYTYIYIYTGEVKLASAGL